ncbi:MAG: homoserine dehydrogenase [Hyphomicrobiales bacterium]|nr:homoserine dehydrogenase [Hyphomicrobiales bacterium]
MRLGQAGLGTIGAPLAQALARGRVPGARLCQLAVRTPGRPRQLGLAHIPQAASLLALARAKELDAVVELIGGADRPALGFVRAALQAGKHVITANKALLARHGAELAALAEANKVGLYYEAAIGGGIPIVKSLRESLVGNRVRSLFGILNGTCNFILSEMEARDLAFADALKAAQKLGLAESNPSADISGADAAQKLALLSSLAFGVKPEDTIAPQGIAQIGLLDMRWAADLGCRIRLLARAEMRGKSLLQEVRPMLVPSAHLLAHMEKARNAIFVRAEPAGLLLLEGEGAGPGPTISSLLADVHDCAAARRMLPFGRSARQWRAPPRLDGAQMRRAWYLRVWMRDEAGSMARASRALAEERVSLSEVVQRHAPPRPAPGQADAPAGMVPVLFVTHACAADAVERACARLRRARVIARDSLLLPLFAESATRKT